MIYFKMCYLILLSLLAASTVTAIRVPVDNTEGDTSASVPIANEAPSEPIYYAQDDIELPSFLIPPDTQGQEGVILDPAPKPATYLLPPSTGKQTDYYYHGSEPDDQSDWYPIAPVLNSAKAVPIILPELNETEALKIIENVRNGKVINNEQFLVPQPSTKLEPPALDAPNDYFVLNSDEIDLPGNVNRRRPVFDIDQRNPKLLPNLHPHNSKLINKPLHVIPHKAHHKIPTKFYPKKYAEIFKPVPIPVSQFADNHSGEIPKAKPLKPYHPILSANTDEYYAPPDDKKIYLYEQFEKKRKEKEESLPTKLSSASGEVYEDFKSPVGEQQTSESHLRYPERNVYAQQNPPRQPEIKNKEHAPPPPGERTEFRMHGMKGPHSYQFGYDTGKGKNRQFRYEERDNDGHVRGHYGYVGRNGKLRIVNYDADPEHGFRAQEPVEKDE